MLKEKEIKRMIKSKRLILSWDEYFLHYLPAIGILVVPILNIYYLATSFFNNDKEGFQRVVDGIGLPIVLLIISSIIFILKYKSLWFKTFDVNNENDRFIQALEQTIKELEWEKVGRQKNYFLGLSESSLIGFGEKITILKADGLIMINSIDNPNNILSNFSFGGNRKNIETFERNLKASVQHCITKIAKSSKIE
jgi:hypothetical protein